MRKQSKERPPPSLADLYGAPPMDPSSRDYGNKYPYVYVWYIGILYMRRALHDAIFQHASMILATFINPLNAATISENR